VTVIDADTRATVGQIDEARGANGVALATDAGRGFTSNGPTNDSTMFDLASLRPIGRIAVGRLPDAIIYDPGTRRVLVSNFGDATLSLIDPAAGAVVGTIALGGTRPEGVAADGEGRAFVNLQGSDAVAVVDLRAMRLLATWPTRGCEHPTAMAYDADVRRLFVGCRGEEPVLLAMDATDGRIVAALPIGRGVDAIAIDRTHHLIVTANGGDASLSVLRQVSDSDYRAVETVGTRAMARTMALDPTNGRIFLVTSEVIRPAGEPGKPPLPFVFVPNTFTVMTYTRRAVDTD
jgi:DNA-binding beta-propeller fold protein YncE